MTAHPDGGFRRIGERPVHDGKVWRVVVAEFESPSGEQFERDVVRSPGAVAVVPLVFDAEGTPSVVLVEQYRPSYERLLLEIPAGMRDVDGEPKEETARRELAEEAGLAADHYEHLADMLPSPGMSDTVTTIFLASGCRTVPQQLHGPEEEHSRLVHVPLADAVAMVERGDIADAKSMVGLLLTDRRCHGGDHIAS